MDSIKCMKDLIKKLDEASYAYYQKDNPIMTDKLYDALYDKQICTARENFWEGLNYLHQEKG